jgi:predicted ribonuclease YlaK
MVEKFYDTNALLNLGEKAFEDFFVCSHKTLEEIEHIKTSGHKDEDTKFKARRLARLFDNNDNYYVCNFDYNAILELLSNKGIECTPDNIIIAEAFLYNQKEQEDGVFINFITDDISCKNIAKNVFELPVFGIRENEDDKYTGFEEVIVSSDEALAEIYQNLDNNFCNCIMNEYLILKRPDGSVIDAMKWNGTQFVAIKRQNLKTTTIGDAKGEIKPKDIYQEIFIDSLCTNQINTVKGDSGTGKSLLSLAYLFSLLEKHKIETIIIFCNTVATINSAKLGYYPGSRSEKLADASIGTMLTSKLGDSIALQRAIDDHKIQLLPMCDIRGFDTRGTKCGVYITEAQNLDISLMKLALQRISSDSICIIDGDYETQVDMSQYAGSNNGMRRMSEVFRGEDIYGEVELQKIYRSRIAEIANKM